MQVNWMEKLGYTIKHLSQLRSCGYLYYKQGQFEIARKIFEALKLLDPENIYHLQLLGAIYLQLDDPRNAIKNIDEALGIDPMNQSALINRFKALLLIGQKQTAADLAVILLQSENPAIKNQVRALLTSYNLKISVII